MVALQIRDVPDDVRDTLASRASARGQSLQAYLLALVTADAGRNNNLEILAWAANRSDGVRLEPGESRRIINEEREARLHRMLDNQQ